MADKAGLYDICKLIHLYHLGNEELIISQTPLWPINLLSVPTSLTRITCW